MKRPLVFSSILGLLTLVVLVFVWRASQPWSTVHTPHASVMFNSNAPLNKSANISAPPVTIVTNTAVNTNPSITNTAAAPAPSVVAPMANFFSRVTKKPFGIYITPQTSPVQPEKFTGYHTGADAETTADEAVVDVPVQAVAAGTVVFAGHVNGYGGVVIIRHTIAGQKLLTLYGHLRISSFKVAVGSSVSAGTPLAVLGTGFTSETDGERKHLHFAVIKGWTITYKGYVTAKGSLSSWIDPVVWLHQQGVS